METTSIEILEKTDRSDAYWIEARQEVDSLTLEEKRELLRMLKGNQN